MAAGSTGKRHEHWLRVTHRDQQTLANRQLYITVDNIQSYDVHNKTAG